MHLYSQRVLSVVQVCHALYLPGAALAGRGMHLYSQRVLFVAQVCHSLCTYPVLLEPGVLGICTASTCCLLRRYVMLCVLTPFCLSRAWWASVQPARVVCCTGLPFSVYLPCAA